MHTPTSTPTSASQLSATEYEPYPIVPSFEDWRFPHNRLPSEWKLPHNPPSQLPIPSPAEQTSPSHTFQAQNRCCLTDFRMGTSECHLIPSEKRDWFGMNGMAEYASCLTGTVDDEANIVILRADLHQLFDQRRFAIVPKPSATLPSSGTPSSTFSAHAHAIHVLDNGEETGEFPDLYQNASIQRGYVDKLSREFLFARSAWALVPLLRSFLETPVSRRLAVIVNKDENKDKPTRILSDLSHPLVQWMNNTQFTEHLHEKGESRNGSRKRRPAQMTRDAETDVEDDAYLDPAQKQLNETTRWYEAHGRYAAVDFCPDDWEDDKDVNRGRSRYR
ncbi:hypothetical protein VP1G_11240 [Cytospora mali]|uniref:HNH nuclease domain-containing protein n=1 Tax=Cytospora mali TaxID=578113 RepID=A0A194VAB6_CYTMA|nr:hypothetical protein VP1G_11240 [Valsa mali var. pyri (nom. inval.)]